MSPIPRAPLYNRVVWISASLSISFQKRNMLRGMSLRLSVNVAALLLISYMGFEASLLEQRCGSLAFPGHGA